jgi:hypothetical protein
MHSEYRDSSNGIMVDILLLSSLHSFHIIKFNFEHVYHCLGTNSGPKASPGRVP